MIGKRTVLAALRLSDKYGVGVEFDYDNSRILFGTSNQVVLAEMEAKMKRLVSLSTICEERAVNIEDS